MNDGPLSPTALDLIRGMTFALTAIVTPLMDKGVLTAQDMVPLLRAFEQAAGKEDQTGASVALVALLRVTIEGLNEKSSP